MVAPPKPAVEPVQPPLAIEPLARRDILLAVAEVGSAYAAKTDDAEQQKALDGRPFSFRIRLCGTLNDDFRASYDKEEEVLRVSVKPNLTAETLLSRGLDMGGAETVEGFWVPRPWLLQAVCPVGGTAPEAENESTEVPAGRFASSVGIAQFSAEQRAQSILRAGRSYEITRKLEQGEVPREIDLVMEGRLRRLSNGKVISCAGDATSQPPTCVVSAQLDRVRLEQTGGELLAEWSES